MGFATRLRGLLRLKRDPRCEASWWDRGGTRHRRYRIPAGEPSPGAAIATLLETVLGERRAGEDIVVWLHDPEGVIDPAFLIMTHLREVTTPEPSADAPAPPRLRHLRGIHWTGWRGSRQDLEALGDRYMERPGGTALVAIGGAAAQPPPTWHPDSAPELWICLRTRHRGIGWDLTLHWNLPAEPSAPPPGTIELPATGIPAE